VGLAGVTVNELTDAVLTVRIVLPLTFPRLAVMVVVPAETALASPLVGAAVLMVATEVTEDDQVTLAVKFCELLSVYVPVAVNCKVV